MANDKNWLLKGLDWAYEKVVGEIGSHSGCWKIADEYLSKYGQNKELAARKMITNQVRLCTTSGFLTSLGGVLTIPVTLPVNLTTVWYMQLQMIATIAVMGGYNPSDHEVQSMCYACLIGQAGIDTVKQAGIHFANQGGKVLIKKLPIDVVKALNKKLGMRFITKFGEKGIVNLGKTVPLLGGIVGGGFDLVSTRAMGNRAIKMFLQDKYI